VNFREFLQATDIQQLVRIV